MWVTVPTWITTPSPQRRAARTTDPLWQRYKERQPFPATLHFRISDCEPLVRSGAIQVFRQLQTDLTAVLKSPVNEAELVRLLAQSKLFTVLAAQLQYVVHIKSHGLILRTLVHAV